MPPTDTLIRSSRFFVKAALVLNRLFLAAVTAGLLLSWLLYRPFAALLADQNPGTNIPSLIRGMRWEMFLGIAMAIAIDRLLSALARIVASTGDPFLAANARRLQSIGWALVALQLLDFPFSLLERYFPALSSGLPSFPFSPGGWLAVLMAFVLSRVFAAGSAMRDDLQGTV